MASARFGRVLTAMVTPFHDDGSLDVDGAVRARSLAGRPRQRRARPRRHHRRGAHAHRRREGRAVDRGPRRGRRAARRRHGQLRHPPHLRAQPSGPPPPVSTGCWSSRRTTTDRRRRGSRRTSGPSPRPPTCPSSSTTSPAAPAARSSTELLVRLATEVPTIVGIKDAAGNPGETARVIAAAPDDFAVWSGDDPMTLPLLAVGAVGVIGTATHWCGEMMSELVSLVHQGRPRPSPGAQRLAVRLVRLREP